LEWQQRVQEQQNIWLNEMQRMNEREVHDVATEVEDKSGETGRDMMERLENAEKAF
jgi:hypothetical protein